MDSFESGDQELSANTRGPAFLEEVPEPVIGGGDQELFAGSLFTEVLPLGIQNLNLTPLQVKSKWNGTMAKCCTRLSPPFWGGPMSSEGHCLSLGAVRAGPGWGDAPVPLLLHCSPVGSLGAHWSHTDPGSEGRRK